MLPLFVLALCLQPGEVIALSPSMEAIDPGKAPPLSSSVPDADRVRRDLRLEPREPYHWVYDVGEAVELTVSGDVLGANEGLLLTIWDWERRPVAQQHWEPPFEASVRLEVDGRGTYLVTLDAMDGDECAARLARSFAVLPSNTARRDEWLAGEYFLGTCSFPERQHWSNDYGPAHPPGLTEQESRALDAALTARLGMQVVRYSPSTAAIWPAEAAPMDFTVSDACYQTLVDAGFVLDLQLMGTPDWMVQPQYAQVEDPKWRYPPRLEPWEVFVRACVERYADATLFYEVNNEVDQLDFWRGTPEEYLAYYDLTAAAIRDVDPDAIIANGGYAYCVSEPEWTGRIARGLLGQIDCVAYHSHGWIPEIRRELHAMRAIHAAAGYVEPVFVNTEMGHAAWRLDQEREMAATAVQKALYCWAQGHRGALLYASREIGGPRQTGTDYGYLDYTFCPRWMYGAVGALMDTYAEATYRKTLMESTAMHAYVFDQAGDVLVTLFTPDNVTRRVRLASSVDSALLIDAMGNARRIVPDEVLVVGLYPVTVRLQAAAPDAVRVEMLGE